MTTLHQTPAGGAVLVSASCYTEGVWLVGVAETPDAPAMATAATTDPDAATEVAELLTDPEFNPEAHDGTTVDWLAWAVHWLAVIAPDEMAGWIPDEMVPTGAEAVSVTVQVFATYTRDGSGGIVAEVDLLGGFDPEFVVDGDDTDRGAALLEQIERAVRDRSHVVRVAL